MNLKLWALIPHILFNVFIHQDMLSTTDKVMNKLNTLGGLANKGDRFFYEIKIKNNMLMKEKIKCSWRTSLTLEDKQDL